MNDHSDNLLSLTRFTDEELLLAEWENYEDYNKELKRKLKEVDNLWQRMKEISERIEQLC